MATNISLKLLATCFVPIILLIATTPANAERWSKQYHIDYTLGDNDSRSTAREIALGKLRLLAAANAGKYIQGEEKLENEKYSQSIRMVTATIVSVSNMKESMDTNSVGQSVFHLSAFATVDDAELKKRIAALQQDQEKVKRLNELELKMNKLMAKLSNHSAAEKNSLSLADLIKKRDRLIQKLHATMHAAQVEFEPGFVFKIADTKYREEHEKQRDIATTIEHMLIPTITDGIKFQFDTQDSSFDGKKYTLSTLVSWYLPMEKLAQSFGVSETGIPSHATKKFVLTVASVSSDFFSPYDIRAYEHSLKTWLSSKGTKYSQYKNVHLPDGEFYYNSFKATFDGCTVYLSGVTHDVRLPNYQVGRGITIRTKNQLLRGILKAELHPHVNIYLTGLNKPHQVSIPITRVYYKYGLSEDFRKHLMIPPIYPDDHELLILSGGKKVNFVLTKNEAQKTNGIHAELVW